MEISRLNIRPQAEYLSVVKSNIAPYIKVLKECLGARREEVLIVCDEGRPGRRIALMLSIGYFLAAKKLGLTPKLVIQKPKEAGQAADSNVIDAFERLNSGNIAIFNSSQHAGKLPISRGIRKFAKTNYLKFISAKNLGLLTNQQYHVYVKSIDLDYKKLADKAARLKETLDYGKEVHITTKKGTDLHMNIRGMTAVSNDGNYRELGMGGNMPAGEVYIAPRMSKNLNGRIVVDASVAVRATSRKIDKPVILEITDGKIVEISGSKEAKELENTLMLAEERSRSRKSVWRIGELGIGINPGATVVGATVIDEKALGTAHVGIGSNDWFGGFIHSNIHLDQVFYNPRVNVDGRLVQF